MRRGRRLIPLVALGLMLTLATTPAEAGKKKKPKPLGPVVTVTATGNTASEDQVSSATATCPAGKQVVGGGFTSPVVLGSAVLVFSSFRSSPTTWLVEGMVAAGSGAVTAHAYCRNTKRRPITDVASSATFSTAGGDIRTLTPSCTRGTLIGGGFQATTVPGDDTFIFPQVHQATSPSTWTTTGVANQDAPSPLTLTAHAYCMAKVKAPAIVSRTNTGAVAAVVAPVASTTPACPAPPKPEKKVKKKKKRKLLSAGGFSVAPVIGTPGALRMGFSDSHIEPAGGWFARAASANSTAGTVSVTSQGICL